MKVRRMHRTKATSVCVIRIHESAVIDTHGFRLETMTAVQGRAEVQNTFDGLLVWSAPGQVQVLREERVFSAQSCRVEERMEIADLHRPGKSIWQIARQVSRAAAAAAASTIGRELRTNAHPMSGRYPQRAAQQRPSTPPWPRHGAGKWNAPDGRITEQGVRRVVDTSAAKACIAVRSDPAAM
jgi:hypothetical protein